MKKIFLLITALFFVSFIICVSFPKTSKKKPPLGPKFFPEIIYKDNKSIDQDDMCIWIHPKDVKKSTIIAADKIANKIFVYNADGKTLQSLDCVKPGNIDLRYNFLFQGEKIDVVATTTRGKENKILIYQVNPKTKLLHRIDDEKCDLEVTNRSKRKSFGGTLYHNKRTQKFYFFKTDEDKYQKIQQYEIYDNGKGSVSLKKVREWPSPGKCEGAVADDEKEVVYICQEKKGIWKFGANPEDRTVGKLVVTPQDTRLGLEGVAIYKTSKEEGYLIVSRQNRDTFQIFDRIDNNYIASFHIDGIISTDGLDITNYSIHDNYAQGTFICHTRRHIVGLSWKTIAQKLKLQTNSLYEIRK